MFYKDIYHIFGYSNVFLFMIFMMMNVIPTLMRHVRLSKDHLHLIATEQTSRVNNRSILGAKKNTTKEILIKNKFILYCLIMFTTVFFRITSCATLKTAANKSDIILLLSLCIFFIILFTNVVRDKIGLSGELLELFVVFTKVFLQH